MVRRIGSGAARRTKPRLGGQVGGQLVEAAGVEPRPRRPGRRARGSASAGEVGVEDRVVVEDGQREVELLDDLGRDDLADRPVEPDPGVGQVEDARRRCPRSPRCRSGAGAASGPARSGDTRPRARGSTLAGSRQAEVVA